VLRKGLEDVFDAYEWELDFDVPHCRTRDDFRKIISEFHAVDAWSYAFRYPIDTRGGAALTSHFRFNLFNFVDVLDGIFRGLDGAVYGAYEELQRENEARAEVRQAEMENADDEDYGYE